MARRLILELIGDPQSLLRSFKRSAEAADVLGRDLKALGVTAEQSARKQVEASVRRDARLRSEVAAYRQIASAAKAGSREQITAANLAAQAEARLGRSLGATAKEQRLLGASVAGTERSLGRAVRGAAAGTGIFRSFGRSIAFASGGFLAFASAGQLLRHSIDYAMQAIATERQLAAQFRAVGQDLEPYRRKIEEATLATSKLSGFTRDDLTQAFTTAFRGTKNVQTGLKIESEAADVARGRHIGLAQSAIVLTKAWAGQSSAARRLGILIPQNLKGMQALAFVGRRFAGQAQAGTTAQERFAAAFQNTEETIGTGLLPQITRLLNRGTDWLDQSKNQQKIQREVNADLKVATQIIGGVADAYRTARGPAHALAEALGGTRTAVKLLLEAMAIKKLATFALGEAAVGGAAVTAAERVTLLRGALARLSALGAITVGVDLIISKKDRGRLRDFVTGADHPSSQQHKSFEDIVNVGQALADAATQIVKGNVGHSGHTLGFNRPPPGSGPLGPQTGAPIGQTNDPFARQRALAEQRERQARGQELAQDRNRLGFKARFAREELALAQAELTNQTSDDRGVLVAEARLIRERIKRIHGKQRHLAEETQLTQQLGSIESQIAEIDKQGAQTDIRFRRLELQLAQAQLTQTQSDDRKVLAVEAQLIRQRLATIAKTDKTLDLRTQLTQQLGQIEGQIQSIDQQALDKRKAAIEKHLQAVKQKEQDLRRRINDITSQFASALDAARQGLGELFQGPVLAPTDAQIKAKLGVPGPNVKKLTEDLNAQVAQFARLQRDLAILAKRGAPKELLKELRAKGVEALPEIEALAKAPREQLKAFFKAFGKGEKLVQNVARAEMRAQLVVLHADRLQLAHLRGEERATNRRARRMAEGGFGTVSKPTLFMAGEGGPEDYAFVPHGKGRLGGGGGPQTIVLHVHNELDGRAIGTSTTKFQTRRQKLITQQRRGGSAGRNPMGP